MGPISPLHLAEAISVYAVCLLVWKTSAEVMQEPTAQAGAATHYAKWAKRASRSLEQIRKPSSILYSSRIGSVYHIHDSAHNQAVEFKSRQQLDRVTSRVHNEQRHIQSNSVVFNRGRILDKRVRAKQLNLEKSHGLDTREIGRQINWVRQKSERNTERRDSNHLDRRERLGDDLTQTHRRAARETGKTRLTSSVQNIPRSSNDDWVPQKTADRFVNNKRNFRSEVRIPFSQTKILLNNRRQQSCIERRNLYQSQNSKINTGTDRRANFKRKDSLFNSRAPLDRHRSLRDDHMHYARIQSSSDRRLPSRRMSFTLKREGSRFDMRTDRRDATHRLNLQRNSRLIRSLSDKRDSNYRLSLAREDRREITRRDSLSQRRDTHHRLNTPREDRRELVRKDLTSLSRDTDYRRSLPREMTLRLVRSDFPSLRRGPNHRLMLRRENSKALSRSYSRIEDARQNHREQVQFNSRVIQKRMSESSHLIQHNQRSAFWNNRRERLDERSTRLSNRNQQQTRETSFQQDYRIMSPRARQSVEVSTRSLDRREASVRHNTNRNRITESFNLQPRVKKFTRSLSLEERLKPRSTGRNVYSRDTRRDWLRENTSTNHLNADPSFRQRQHNNIQQRNNYQENNVQHERKLLHQRTLTGFRSGKENRQHTQKGSMQITKRLTSLKAQDSTVSRTQQNRATDNEVRILRSRQERQGVEADGKRANYQISTNSCTRSVPRSARTDTPVRQTDLRRSSHYRFVRNNQNTESTTELKRSDRNQYHARAQPLSTRTAALRHGSTEQSASSKYQRKEFRRVESHRNDNMKIHQKIVPSVQVNTKETDGVEYLGYKLSITALPVTEQLKSEHFSYTGSTPLHRHDTRFSEQVRTQQRGPFLDSIQQELSALGDGQSKQKSLWSTLAVLLACYIYYQKRIEKSPMMFVNRLHERIMS